MSTEFRDAFEASTTVLYGSVVTATSALIMRAEQILENERAHPFNADKSDDKIKFFSERVASLRELRQTFESVMNKVAP